MRSRTLFSLVLLAVVGACATDIPTPTSPASLARAPGATRSNVSGGHGTANSKKYRDSGLHPATGRSGSTSLEARALLGADGNTVVEASTGSLEAGTSSGTIAKVQLKSPGTQNFNGLSNNGYWSTSVAGLSRGQPIQLQANVRGIDPKRTDVVAVTTPAAKRPDVVVNSVSAASSAPPNVPVTISGTVSELNGDVGARADCVLSINGAEVDRADGIWVDALGTVTCLFSHTFTAAGTYDVRITASNVAPGDWDTSNNSSAATTTVAPLGGTINHGSMSVNEMQYSYDYFTWSVQPDVAYDRQMHYAYNLTSIYAYGSRDHFAEQPFKRIDVSVEQNGATVLSESLAIAYYDAYDDGSTFRQKCSSAYGNGRWFDVCAQDYYGASPSYTYYNAQVVQGSVTYLGHDRYCYSYGCNTYLYNYADAYGGSTSSLGLTAGSAIRFRVNFVGPNDEENSFDETMTPLIRYDFGPWNDYSSCYSSPSYSSCWGQSNFVGHYLSASVYW